MKVLFEPGHHVKLFKKLRALSQRIEFARLHPRRNEEIAGSARSVLDHNGRLELEEAVLVKIASRDLIDAVAHSERFLQRSAAQVEVSVLQPLFFVRIDGVGNLEWRSLALVEDRELDGMHFDIAGGNLRVLVGAPARDHAAHADHPLAAQRSRHVVGGARQIAVTREIGIKDELGDALAIPQVDKYAAAMVAVAGYPSEKNDQLAFVCRAQLAAVVGTLQLVDESGHFGATL